MRSEASLHDKVKAAAEASLARLFPEFLHADDNRWSTVIKRARGGTEHPLEVLEYSGSTEQHPVCAAVLGYVGAGKTGNEVRSQFLASPYGWPKDAIDGALISLFEAGHLRASLNGAALQRKQLDQVKISRADFRTESVTITTPQRLKLRQLFHVAGIPCKSNEEAAAAAEYLGSLKKRAGKAGGDAPLPRPPDTRHLSDLQALAGNEQLIGILDKKTTLEANCRDWSKAEEMIAEPPAGVPALANPHPVRGWHGGCGRYQAPNRGHRH